MAKIDIRRVKHGVRFTPNVIAFVITTKGSILTIPVTKREHPDLTIKRFCKVKQIPITPQFVLVNPLTYWTEKKRIDAIDKEQTVAVERKSIFII